MPRRSSPNSLSPTLWVAAGAAAGLLVGIAIADRSTSVRRLMRRAGEFLPAFTGLLRLVERQRLARVDAPLGPVAPSELDWGADVYEDAYDHEYDVEFDEAQDDDVDDDDADESLDGRVLSAYDADPLLSTLPIEIDSPEPGTITLDGVVPSARLIAHAVTIARGTPGVERVEHRLTVRRPRRPSAGGASGR